MALIESAAEAATFIATSSRGLSGWVIGADSATVWWRDDARETTIEEVVPLDTFTAGMRKAISQRVREILSHWEGRP
jgi:hypothetical protein